MDRTNMQRINGEDCPVPDHVLGAVSRATPAEALALTGLLPSTQRAKLALYCYGRSHLREAGLAIAVACHDGDLIRYGGIQGQALVAQRRVPERQPGFTTRRGVTLSSAAVQHLFVTTDDDGEIAELTA